jgi:hypothetical protein
MNTAAEQEPGMASPTQGGPFASSSTEAKRLAAAVLEVLAGARLPSEAASVLGISLARYYQLEMKALGGLVTACESGRRGRGRKPANELVALRQECDRLRRDCSRQQALVRAAQRTVGLAPPAPPVSSATGGKKRRRRKPTARALKMAALLQDARPLASTNGTEAAPSST